MASGPLDFSALDGDLPCQHRDGAPLEAKYAAAADAVSSIRLEDTEICTIYRRLLVRPMREHERMMLMKLSRALRATGPCVNIWLLAYLQWGKTG